MIESSSDERLALPSASSFSRTVECPGWRNLWNRIVADVYDGVLPQESPSEEAERGTRIHRARETMSPLELRDDDEILAFERWCSLERDCVRAWLGSETEFSECTRELRLWLTDPETLQPLCSARLDIHYRNATGTRYLCVDGKTGAAKHAGRAKDNWQLKLTAVCINWEYDPNEVTLALVKPEAWPRPHFDVVAYTKPELASLDSQVRFHIAQSQRPDAPRRPGDECLYCPCKPHCPEYAAYALLPSVVGAMAIESLPSKKEIQARVTMLTPADWAFIWKRSTALKNLIDATTDQLKKLPENELAALGIGFSKGRTTTKITDTKSACERLVATGFDEGELWKMLALPKPALVDAIRSKFGLSEEKAETSLAAILQNIIESNTGERSLKEI